MPNGFFVKNKPPAVVIYNEYNENFTRSKNPLLPPPQMYENIMLFPVILITPSRVTQLAFFNNELKTFEWTYSLFSTKENEG